MSETKEPITIEELLLQGKRLTEKEEKFFWTDSYSAKSLLKEEDFYSTKQKNIFIHRSLALVAERNYRDEPAKSGLYRFSWEIRFFALLENGTKIERYFIPEWKSYDKRKDHRTFFL